MSPQAIIQTTGDKTLILREKLRESKENVRKLKKERDLLIKALDDAGIGVILEGKKSGKWQVLNKGVSRITGYQPEEVSSRREWSNKLYADATTKKRAAAFARRIRNQPRAGAEDFHITAKNGRNRVIRMRTKAVRDRKKGADTTLNIITDVTKETELEKEFKYRQDFGTRLFDYSVDGLCILDTNMRIVHVNRAIIAYSGLRKKELIGKPATKFVLHKQVSMAKKLFSKAIEDGYIGSTRMQLFNGRSMKVDVEISVLRLNDSDKNISGVLVIIHDITVRLSRKDKLKRLSSIVYNSPMPIIELDMENRIKYANSAFENLFGYSSRKIVGKHVRMLHHRPSYGEMEKEINRALHKKGQWMGEAQLHTKSRGSFIAEIRISATYDSEGRRSGFTAFYSDITERKKAEEAREKRTDKLEKLVDKRTDRLLETEEMLKRFLRYTRDGVLIINPKRKIIDANEEMLRLLGYKRGELIGKPTIVIYKNRDERSRLHRLIQEKGLIRTYFHVLTKQRETKIVNATAWIDKDESGKLVRYVVVMKDATDRIRAEEELRKSEQRFRSFLDNMTDIAYRVDKKGLITYANEATAKVTGIPLKDIIGKDLRHFFTKDSRKPAWQSFRDVISGKSVESELTFINGRICRFKTEPLRDKEGNTTGVFGIARDVTKRKKAEKQMTILQAVTENASDSIAMGDLEGRLTYSNRACYELFRYNYERREMTGMPITNFWPKKDAPTLTEQIIPYAIKTSWKGEVRQKRKDGTIFDAFMTVFPVLDNANQLIGLAAIIRDITDQKRREQILCDSELKYRTTINSMADAIHMVDRDLRIVLVNKALKKWSRELGLSEDMVGRTVFEIFPFLPDRVRKEFESVFKSNKTLITEETTVLGDRRITTETRKIPVFEVGKVTRVITVVRDITRRKAMEQTLRHRVELERLLTSISTQFINLSSDKFDTAISHTLDMLGEFSGSDRACIYLISDDGTIMENTHEWCAEGIKHEIDKLKGITVKNFPWTMKRLRNLENIHVPRVNDLPAEAVFEKKRFKKMRLKSVLGVPMAFEGSLLGFLSFDFIRTEKIWAEEDIAILRTVGEIFSSALQRKRTEEALRESEATATALLNASDDPMLLMSTSGTIIATNEVTARLVSKTVNQLVGSRLFDYYAPKIAKFRSEKFKEAILTKQPLRFEDDSADRIYDTTIQPIFDDKGNVTRLAIIARDITDQKRLDEQLIVSAKLASLGHFVAGIAHEINNPLASIKLDIQRLRKKALLTKECDNILNTLSRISQIVDNLLKYSRGQRTVLKSNNIEKIIESAIELVCERFKKENKKIFRKFESQKSLVFSDFGQLQQVFLNLALNACDALKKGGNLEIDTAYRPESNKLQITFRDNGKGIPKREISRILDPFFTTKTSGTGLGLSISHKIIENHDGTIEFKSTLGRGTEVIILLPATKRKTAIKKK